MTDPLQDPGVQGLAQLGRNAIERVASLERTIATLQMRLRRAGQLLIEEIGANGPESADDTAERAAGVIRKQADTIAKLESEMAGYAEANKHLVDELDDALEDARKYCEAQAEIARLRVNSDRYEWLRDNPTHPNYPWFCERAEKWHAPFEVAPALAVHVDFASLDEAMDKVMK